ncbi:hypothetical protein [Canicola haemoglobinophilus]|uniref:hypothetical protein n=1 Tax=Canicola haemoglobinophilus TaxID=733 RepID=UPI000DFC22B8|nr:hypothetical protein [Canicola haemoglobinophilus]STO55705.1 Uncharacterised protein [Canicola haemoglobinophilus]
MKKIMLSTALVMAAFAANAADLHPKCEEYFKAVDAYVEKAPAAVKQQMSAGKEQMKMMSQRQHKDRLAKQHLSN